jgi:hypothetical protein
MTNRREQPAITLQLPTTGIGPNRRFAAAQQDVSTEGRPDGQRTRPEPPFWSSRPEDFHLRALPEPYVSLSIHTAPDVRPLP